MKISEWEKIFARQRLIHGDIEVEVRNCAGEFDIAKAFGVPDNQAMPGCAKALQIDTWEHFMEG